MWILSGNVWTSDFFYGLCIFLIPKGGQFTVWVLERILNTIFSWNLWMGALALQLMSAIPVPTDLRVGVIKGSSFPVLSVISALWCSSRVISACEGTGLGPWSSTTPLSEEAQVTLANTRGSALRQERGDRSKAFIHANDLGKGTKLAVAGAELTESRMFCKVFCEPLSTLTGVERTCLSCSINWMV